MADNVIAIQVNVDGIENAISHFNSLAESFGKLAQGAQEGTSGSETLQNSLENVANAVKEASSGNDELGNSLSEIADAANEAGDDVEKLGDSNTKASESADKLSESSEKAADSAENLGESSDKTAEAFEKLNTLGKDVGETLSKSLGNKIPDSISKIGSKFSGLVAPLKKVGEAGKKAFSFLGNSIGGKISDLSSKLKNLFNIVSSASANGGGLGAIGGAISGLAGLATGPVGAAVIAIGAVTAATAAFSVKALKASSEFQQGMNKVFTMLPKASQETKDKLSNDILELSNKYGKSANEMSEAMYQALSAGVEQNKVKEFLEVAQKGATAGVTDVTTAVDGLSSIVNAWGENAISAAQASDLIFTAVKNGKTSFGEIAGSIAQVSPIASALGVDFSDVAAAIGTLTAKGTPTSVVMTQMKAAFSEFSKGSTTASKEFKAATGQSFQEFIAKGGNLQTAMQALETHAKKTGKNINEFFGSVEAGSFALSLTGENTASFTKNMQDMKNSKGATDKAFAQMDQGITVNTNKIRENLHNTMIQAGQAITPMASQMLQGFTGIMPALISAFSSIGSSVMPLMSGWASLFNGFFQTIQANASQFGAVFQGIGTLTTVVWSAVGASLSVLGAIFNAVFGIIINLLGSFMSAAGLAGSQGQTFASTISGAFSTIASVVGGALQFIMPLLIGLAQIIGGVLGGAVKGIVNAFLLFGKTITAVGDFFKKLFGKDDAEQATAAINEVKKGMEELNAEAAKPTQKQVDINAQINTQMAQMSGNGQFAGIQIPQFSQQQSMPNAQPQTIKLDPTAKIPIDPLSLAGAQMKIDPTAFNEMQMKVDPNSFANTQMKIDPAAFNNLQQAIRQVSSDIKGNPLDTTRNSILGEIKGQISALKGEIASTRSAIVGKLGEVVGAVRAIKINVNVPAAPSGDAIANKIAASLQKG